VPGWLKTGSIRFLGFRFAIAVPLFARAAMACAYESYN
jgi:hypothetical protein